MQCVRRFRTLAWVGALWGLLMPVGASAQSPQFGPASSPQGIERTLPKLDAAQWVERMRADPCARTYTGALVVSAASGAMTSSRMWHACIDGLPVVRVEPQTGVPRVVFRHGDEVRTFNLQARTVRVEPREPARGFPAVPLLSGAAVSQHYGVKLLGSERVAGAIADGVAFVPQDAWRFGYRFWIERDSGLVLKLQTVGPDGRMLEQTAFSQLDLKSPVRAEELLQSVQSFQGFQIEMPSIRRTAAEAEGWVLRQIPPGFVSLGCFLRQASPKGDTAPVLQCVYSDGLASVSVFLEDLSPQRPADKAQTASIGATHLWAQRVKGDAWTTVVGEVPLATLRAFAHHIERLR
ncbi:sigma factor AlgU regulator MucB [Acidovorax lacteus]|uniref:Sigma factor AlgU regulator MucB n=2 Tax=Acidovorax lacteus TaxID=1924988 RepID=A0ABP8LG66_9BURK